MRSAAIGMVNAGISGWKTMHSDIGGYTMKKGQKVFIRYVPTPTYHKEIANYLCGGRASQGNQAKPRKD